MLLRFPHEDKILIATPSRGGDARIITAPFCGAPEVFPARIRLSDLSDLSDLPDLPDLSHHSKYSQYSHHSGLSDSTPEEHLRNLELCIARLKAMPEGSKIVLARTRTTHSPLIDAAWGIQLFAKLASERKDACAFIFSRDNSGIWVGATPEVLLETDCRGSRPFIASASLAGTMPADCDSPWDDKNIEEQRIVTDSIMQTYRSHGLAPVADGPDDLLAGNVRHLHTRICSPLPEGWHLEDTLKLADDLSPTPALGGYPRQEAIDFITAHEKIPREYYGGYFGIATPERTRLYVNIRSLRLFPAIGAVRQYAGGGITRHSDPQTELTETVNKFNWLHIPTSAHHLTDSNA